MEFQLLEKDKELKSLVDKTISDYEIASKELNKQWEMRVDDLEKRCHRAIVEKEEALLQLTRLTDSVSTMKHEHQIEMKEMLYKMRKDLV